MVAIESDSPLKQPAQNLVLVAVQRYVVTLSRLFGQPGARAVGAKIGPVLHPTNVVQPLMSGVADAGPGGRARAIVQIVRNAFESPGPPDRDVLRTLALPREESS